MVQSYSERIYENKYKINSPHVPSRVERLLRERELRKSSRASQPNKETEDNNNNKGTPPSEKDVCLRKDDYSRVCKVEPYLKEGSVARIQDKGREKQIERPSSRILVVANRLPVSAVRRGEASWSLEKSAGGLVSSLMGVEFEKRWIGWAGINVPDEIGQTTLTQALAEKKCIPVFLDEEIVQQYYNGYCNNILWPLFHYLGLPQEDQLATTCSFQSQFAAYQKANQMFADVVNKHYEEGDVVWCHDYHLMFLPKCLKEYNRSMKVGWFLHTPFPSSEIHRTLPSRSELLHSVLAADLVGFHTYDYARHFVSACTRILGLEGTPEGVEVQGRLTRVAAFPVGIDSWRFMDAVRLPEIEEQINDLKKRFGVKKVILGVDRLDMIKGIPHKILAFEKFLEENPNWRDKVVLLQVAVPTRTDVSQYQKLTSQVHEIVGRINGRFGTMTNVPLLHLDRCLDFNELCALYAVTDVALITSLRDGMNLVSYEFVACQDAKKGVLILSEFAGAAQSLGAGAILVNPWNITEVAAAIGQALNMQPEEREKRHQLNFMHVKVHTSQEWAETFISELNDTVVEVELRTREAKPPFPVNIAVDRYLKSISRLLILGFNATLTEPVDVSGRRGDQIKEMELKLHPDLKEPLRALCNDPKTITLVLSGSEKSILDDNFGELDMCLAAENGMFFRHTEREWTTTMPEDLNLEWIDSVKHVFEYFTERTPRSHFVQRETSLVWNYKYADVEFGRLQARDMLEHLCTGPISNASVDVVQGSHSVEVRTVGSSKGATIRRILGDIFHTKMKISPIDYVLCIGHFLGKDEDVYTFFDVNKKTNTTGGYQSRSKRSRRNESKSSNSHAQRNQPNPEKKIEKLHENQRRSSTERVAWDVLDLKGDNYFSCAVGRNATKARFLLGSSDEVVSFLKQLADATSASSSSSPCDRYSF